ncbi:MAG: hypothetical protein WAX89_00600 [Alphaproteobacteria bacterium]
MKLCRYFWFVALVLMAAILAAPTLWAEDVTEDAAHQAYQQAVESYSKLPPQALEPAEAVPAVPQVTTSFSMDDDNALGEDLIEQYGADAHYMDGIKQREVDLSALAVKVNFEDVRLEDAMGMVVNDLAEQSGVWRIKWRLKPEHDHLKDERVNLIAESNFGDFVTYLTDRVRNMTGVQLFISVFNESRVIVISDTFN